MVDVLLDNPLPVGGALAVLLGAAGGLAFLRRRRRAEPAQRIANPYGPATSENGSAFGSVGGQAVDTGSSVVSQPGEPSQISIGVIDTEEVDPLAEADVYMAYGRDTQAEEILREALHKAPGRAEVRGKLLEIYAQRKDARAFGAAATELFVATKGTGPDWERAAALGAQLDPTNPMYRAVGDARPAEGLAGLGAGSGAVQIDAGLSTSLGTPSVGGGLTRGLASAAARDIAFDLDLGRPPDQNSMVMDLDLSSPVTNASLPAASPGVVEFERETSSQRPVPSQGAQARPVDAPIGAAVSPAFDLGEIDLDLGPLSVSAPTESDARWQETATKLDLARVYHDMGHHDDARELLAEVLKEGDIAQQAQARKLIENLG